MPLGVYQYWLAMLGSRCSTADALSAVGLMYAPKWTAETHQNVHSRTYRRREEVFERRFGPAAA